MARKNKVQYTENQQLFRKLKTRLKRKVRNAEKRGFIFPEGFTDFEMPKRVTQKALEKLESVIKNVYEYSRYFDPLSGKTVEGTERRKEERSIAARKAAETLRRKRQKVDTFWTDESGEYWYEDYSDEYLSAIPNEELTILEQLRNQISYWEADPRWSPALAQIKNEDVSKLSNILEGEIASVGINEVARNIVGNAEELISLANQIMYESGDKYKQSGREGVRINLNRIAAIIKGRPLTVMEAMDIEELNITFNEYE